MAERVKALADSYKFVDVDFLVSIACESIKHGGEFIALGALLALKNRKGAAEDFEKALRSINDSERDYYCSMLQGVCVC